jgi:hypothetical protein
VKFIEQDLFTTDIRQTTVVTVYLLPELNLQLHPKLLRDLRLGTRIVSHEYNMGDWKPDNMGTVRKAHLYYFPIPMDVNFYYWVIPADTAGEWSWSVSTSTGKRDYTLRIIMKFQEIKGEFYVNGRELPIERAKLVGEELSFALPGDVDEEKAGTRFSGRIDGDTISGSVEVQGGPSEGNKIGTATRKRQPGLNLLSCPLSSDFALTGATSTAVQP